MSTRKRRGGAINSRQTQKRTREATSTPEISLEAEPIELVETAGDEIVDLTCESLEPVVVDLTHNDSVVTGSSSVAQAGGQGPNLSSLLPQPPKFKRSSCLSLRSTGTTGTHCHAQLIVCIFCSDGVSPCCPPRMVSTS
ncbi:E3 ubiquitin-protein ligase RNF4 isoform X2 [Macaca fascicularis]|uniref:E3 ubiquitin-protein ligase RNF4 isoform X2 n=1 Tax=Macaca fascicularis TaxID=9541 RepID=UPI003D15784F